MTDTLASVSKSNWVSFPFRETVTAHGLLLVLPPCLVRVPKNASLTWGLSRCSSPTFAVVWHIDDTLHPGRALLAIMRGWLSHISYTLQTESGSPLLYWEAFVFDLDLFLCHSHSFLWGLPPQGYRVSSHLQCGFDPSAEVAVAWPLPPGIPESLLWSTSAQNPTVTSLQVKVTNPDYNPVPYHFVMQVSVPAVFG